MAVIARGSLAERSAPRLFAALARKGFTGELVVEAGARTCRIAWSGGAVVGAQSGHPADSAAKVAIGLGVLNSTQAGEVARIVAGAPGVDELEVVAQAARLSTDLLGRLARRVVAARAARAMSAEAGTYTVDDALPAWGHVAPIDARWILYSGVRSHYTLDRAGRELAAVAPAIRLRAGADLDGFGFGATEEPVLARLGAGELPLAPMPAGLDQQVAQAMALALLYTGEAEPVRAAPVVTQPPPVTPPPPVKRAPTPTPTPAPTRAQPTVTRPAPTPMPPAEATERPRSASSVPPPRDDSRTSHAPAVVAARERVRALIAERLAVLERHPDHYEMLGVSRDATPEEIRNRYFVLARSLHPDRLTAVGVDDQRREAQRVFARINEAFSVLSDADRRHRYREVLAAGGEAAIRAREAETEAKVRRTLDAEERFRLGEMALRRQQLDMAVREFSRAVELDPEEADHHALLGWATYVAAADKSAAVPVAHGHLQRAIEKSPTSPTAPYYLGRMLRMEGNDAEAARQLQRALELAPNHAEAAAELRAIESRRGPTPADKPDKKGGLFSRLIKKS